MRRKKEAFVQIMIYFEMNSILDITLSSYKNTFVKLKLFPKFKNIASTLRIFYKYIHSLKEISSSCACTLAIILVIIQKWPYHRCKYIIKCIYSRTFAFLQHSEHYFLQ